MSRSWDPMLSFLLKMASTIKVMVLGKLDARLRRSTGYIANAFHRTLHAVVYIIKKLLDVGFDYVLLGKIQSDRLEEKIGIYRCSSGSNYFITCEQYANSLSMQRLKLYSPLDIQQSNDEERPCCLEDVELNEDDIALIENCFAESSCFSEEELSAFFYISDYVAYKEGSGVAASKKC